MAGDPMSDLSQDQWNDAFRAGGYDPAVAERFIRRLLAKVAEGSRVGTKDPRLTIAPPVGFTVSAWTLTASGRSRFVERRAPEANGSGDEQSVQGAVKD